MYFIDPHSKGMQVEGLHRNMFGIETLSFFDKPLSAILAEIDLLLTVLISSDPLFDGIRIGAVRTFHSTHHGASGIIGI